MLARAVTLRTRLKPKVGGVDSRRSRYREVLAAGIGSSGGGGEGEREGGGGGREGGKEEEEATECG